jgi:hypothetical protein
MTSKTLVFNNLVRSFLLMSVIATGSLCAALRAEVGDGQHGSSAGSTDVRGTWSGTFFSRHANVAPFTMTVVITQDARGNFIGTSSLNSDCLKGVPLQVTVTGSKVVLAGSDEEGDNITVRGTLDNTSTLLESTYILNGSATGKCETDGGTGKLSKR